MSLGRFLYTNFGIILLGFWHANSSENQFSFSVSFSKISLGSLCW